MGIINTQAVTNAKKVLTGKNGALYNAKGKLLATMETYQAQVNVTNTKFQPLGDPQEHEIFTSYGQTLTFTEIVVEDGEFITDLLAGMKSGEMPSWNFQGVIKGRNGSEERLVYNDCVPSGNIDLQNVTYKIPYETHPEDRPRQCVFVGTSNNMDFLPLDRTGNRRFAPVLVHPERVEKHILEDEKESREYIRQAWAEAMELYRNGFHELKLSGKTEEYLKEMQKDFMPEDAKVGIIQNWLDELAEDYVCSIMIYKEAFSHEYDTPKDWELKEINNVMNHSIVGWEKISSHRFAGYGTQRGWRRVAGKNEFQNLPEDVVIPFEER